MRQYIELKLESEADAAYKKLRVFFGSGSYPNSTEQGRVMGRTTTGRLSYQIGPRYKYWYGEFRVKTTEDSGFASLADLDKWMTSDTPSDHKLRMRSWGWLVGTNITYKVVFVTGIDPLPQVPYAEGADGFQRVTFRLEERAV